MVRHVGWVTAGFHDRLPDGALAARARCHDAGVASSACTFGVLSITQPLFKKGASAEASFAFSFASTNLVIKLGLLVYGKLGWPLLVAERLGGSLLVSILMELVFRKLGWIPPRLSVQELPGSKI
ncbi:MAG: hypothetical protein CMG80_21295 [Marinobacter sp.]|nr:hypothetical protein [Marinobacter sp.]